MPLERVGLVNPGEKLNVGHHTCASSVRPDKMSRAVDGVRRLNPSLVLSSHLPPIHRGVDVVLKTIEAVPHADPAPALTQAELQVLLDQFEPAS